MTSPQQTTARDLRRAALINRYATPFAVFLVALAIFLPSPIHAVRNLCLGLLAFSVAFNLGTARLIRLKPETLPRIKKLRMFTNLAVNVILVYELGPYWPPMWLLLALTPIATAIYSSPRQSLITSMITAFLIMGIRLCQGGSGAIAWGQTLSYAGFVIFVSLLLNDMAHESTLNDLPKS